MSAPAKLRALAAEDAALLARLHATGFEEPWPPEAFARLLENPLRRGALACAAGDAAGFILVQAGPDESEVITLVVAPDFRRQGIAELLLQWSLEQAKELGLQRLILDVKESNVAAIRLYRKLGFSQIGQRSGYYRRSSGVENAFVLARSVV